MDAKPKDIFGTFARIEMFTWALLIAAIVVRETVGLAPSIFTIAGATHGFAFIGYSVTAVLVGVNQRWPLAQTAMAVVLAIVPFATYPFDRYLDKKSMMEGEWRIEGTNDPRDNTWFDRLFRWFIFRPLLLIFTLVVFVVSLFAFLLWLGPPYEWGR
jgi:integral membrane protein